MSSSRRPAGREISGDVPGMLADALQYHQAGRLTEAEQIYRRILTLNPQHADSLNLLGMIAHRWGHHDAAVDMIRQAIAINKTAAVYHCNLGTVLQAQAKLDEAVACLQDALSAGAGTNPT